MKTKRKNEAMPNAVTPNTGGRRETVPEWGRLIVVGTGLLGGSVAAAAKKNRLAEEIVGLDRCASHRETAVARGIIDRGASGFRDAFTGLTADDRRPILVVAAVPVAKIADVWVRAIDAIQKITPKRAETAQAERQFFLTDTGSVKNGIFEAFSTKFGRKILPKNLHIVGSHPVAGGEKSGPTAASADLFAGRLTVLTPFGGKLPGRGGGHRAEFAPVVRFWERLGSRVTWLSATEHDRNFSQISHLPHIASLVLALAPERGAIRYAGSGFADMTRLAAGNSAVWADILMMNRREILQALEAFEREFHHVRDALAQEDAAAILRFLKKAGKNKCSGK